MTTRERKERRLERRKEWAEGRKEKSRQSFGQADRIASGIPMGQPILVGHHSEKRHRRDVDKIHNSMAKGVEHQKMASHHEEKAHGIQRQLDKSIFSDDPDAIERLQEKLEGLVAERDRMKAVNTWLRKNRKRFGLSSLTGLDHNTPPSVNQSIKEIMIAVVKEMALTRKEQGQLFDALRFNRRIGFPPYALTNLGGNIKRTRDRLEELKGEGNAQDQ